MPVPTREQSHAVMAILAQNVDWEALDMEVLQKKIVRNPKQAGSDFTSFLESGGREPRILKIDRSSPFDPVSFLGEGWKVVEEDERALALTEIDLSKVYFDSMVKESELSISHKTKQKRLREGKNIPLDAKCLQTLWEDKHYIPELWRFRNSYGQKTLRDMNFDATILRRGNDQSSVLGLSFACGKWQWRTWPCEDRHDFSHSVLLLQ
jgi:hypothetical protein